MADVYRRERSPYWYARIADPSKATGYIRLSTGQVNKRDAQRFARQLEEEALAKFREAQVAAEARKLEGHTGLRFTDAWKMFCASGMRKESTVKQTQWITNIVLASPLGDFDLGSLTPSKIKEFVHWRRSNERFGVWEKRSTTRGNKAPSDATIRLNVFLISTTIQYCIDNEVPGAPTMNPARQLPKGFFSKAKLKARHLRPVQFKEILDALENVEYRRMLIILVSTGLRSGELVTLKWSQIDLSSGYLEVGYEDDADTKTSRSRRVPLNALALQALTSQRDTLQADGSYFMGNLVFPRMRGRDKHGRRTVQRSSLALLNHKIKEVSGLTSYTNHRLRHSFTSWSLQKGVDPITVKEILGHVTLAMTSRYAHQISDETGEEFKKIDLI